MLFPSTFTVQNIVKQDTVTVTIETNLRQGEAVVDGTKGDVIETETESNEALSEWEEGRIIDFRPEQGCGLPQAAARSYG